MARREPEIESIDVAELAEPLAGLVERVDAQAARVMLTRDGEPVAAVISAWDLALFRQFEARRAERWQAIERIRARNADKSPDEVEHDVAEILAEVRAEMRAEDRAKAASMAEA